MLLDFTIGLGLMDLRVKVFVGAILVLLSAGLGCFQPVEGQGQGQVVILSHSSFIDIFGYYDVVGEVKNVGDQPVEWVTVTATFYDSEGQVVGTNSAYTYLEVLLPGRKSPFKIVETESAVIEKITNYSLKVSFQQSAGLPMGLQIVSNSSYVDEFGWFHVTGEIKNIGTATANYVEVIGTFYDAEGTVVYAFSANPEPRILEPNQKASFELVVGDKSRADLISSYELTAESEEYAIIPEFPLHTLILTLTTLILALFAIHGRVKEQVSFRK